MFEDEVIPLFEKIGKLFQFRLMMDFSGTNRGFAFARYFNKNDAKMAVEKLNDFEVRNGQRIGVVLSVDNCRLYFGRIPRDKTCDEVEKEIRRITEGVIKVILYPNTEDRTKNRGFIFVEYESHKAATVARRKLIPGQVTMWGCPVEVDWAEPLPEPDDDVIAQVKILYVRNLMPSTTEIQLKNIFELITGKNTIEHVKKMKDYAFIHFKEKKDAALALQQMHGEMIDNSRIEVVWAKPVDKNLKRLKNLQTASNFQHLLNNPSNQPILTPLTTLASSIVFPPSYGLFTMPPPTQHFLFPTPFQTMSYDPNGSRNLPAFPTCPEPFNSNFTPPTGEKATSTNNSSPVSSLDSPVAAQLAGSPGVEPYVGMPFIDPTAGNSFSQPLIFTKLFDIVLDSTRSLAFDLFRELAHYLAHQLPLNFPCDVPQTLAYRLPHDLSRHLAQQ
uniref:RRM domain-containing protein n=1 Tax=Romanomermis culicivorax TaxID=13658 RepID=A0A915HEV0_ROMCU